jgi:hypothetical protein
MRNLSVDLQVTTLNVDYRYVPEYSCPFLLGSASSEQPRTGSPVPNSVERQLRGLEMGDSLFL